ncbi:MAG: DUF3787 domain-containing protein [Defluviitaleaceae bacterium]|nr:DUF3787 domain-containing protein [Defluviitaleaceae bacterium]
MNNKNEIPTNKGLQKFATSTRDFNAPLFESISIADDSEGHMPKSNIAIPSTMAIEEAKDFIDNKNKL